MKFSTLLFLVTTVLFATPAIAQNTTDLEILKQKIKADKKLLVAGNMELNDEEAQGFWPLYDSYQKDLEHINQRLGRTIREYSEAYNKGSIPNDTAKRLMNEALAVEEAEVNLKRTYAEKLAKVLPATKVARYMQMETKIRSLLRVELAQQIPLVY